MGTRFLEDPVTHAAPEPIPRIAHTTAEVAAMLGLSPDALRRRCERAAVPGEGAELVAHLDLGIMARKRGGRWVFLVPPELLAHWRK
ncbi:MAG: hypothetical protein KC776_29155 [Myxococcales bacterium]|nr:hypothetical protein [Myxococcales bacterium]